MLTNTAREFKLAICTAYYVQEKNKITTVATNCFWTNIVQSHLNSAQNILKVSKEALQHLRMDSFCACI